MSGSFGGRASWLVGGWLQWSVLVGSDGGWVSWLVGGWLQWSVLVGSDGGWVSWLVGGWLRRWSEILRVDQFVGRWVAQMEGGPVGW